MLSKSVIQFAGEYLLEDSKILSVSGSVFDIKDLIEEKSESEENGSEGSEAIYF